MSKYIDGERLQNHVALYMAENAYINDSALDILKMVSKWINEAPTVDAEPVRHGRWEFGKQHEDFVQVECSACGGWLLVKWHDDIDRYRYCPNCGSKMQEVK